MKDGSREDCVYKVEVERIVSMHGVGREDCVSARWD